MRLPVAAMVVLSSATIANAGVTWCAVDSPNKPSESMRVTDVDSLLFRHEKINGDSLEGVVVNCSEHTSIKSQIDFMFSQYCSHSNEASYGLYEFQYGGDFVRYLAQERTYADKDPEKAKVTVPLDQPDEDERFSVPAKLVALIHDHPAQKDANGKVITDKYTWPSVADVKAILSRTSSIPMYIHDCGSEKLLMFDPNDGQVYLIDELGRKLTASKGGSYYGDEQFGITDKSVYDPDKFKALKMVIARSKNGAVFEGNQIETDKLQYIDTAKFESLIKDLINERIALLKEMLAKGKESAKSYIPLLNDNVAKLRDVFADIVSKINEAYTSVPEREKAAESIFKSIFMKYESLCNEAVKLQNDVETRGMGRFEDIPLSARQQNALETFYMKRR